VSDFVYNLIKQLKLSKEQGEWTGFIVFNTVFGINIAKEIKSYAKYLDAIFIRAHRAKFIKYEV